MSSKEDYIVCLLIILTILGSIIIFLTFEEEQETPEQLPSPYKLECELVEGYMRRCENKEVVCYSSRFQNNVDPDCKFKEREI